jgi:hypothetical protein
MKPRLRLVAALLAASALFTTAAQAHDELSAVSALSALPIASVAGAASAVAGSVVVLPVALSAAGAVLVVKTVEVSARGSVYVLERVSDGARVSVEIADRGMRQVSVATGTLVTVSVVGAGVVLSAAGEAIAFIPNAIGQALLYNEQITR